MAPPAIPREEDDHRRHLLPDCTQHGKNPVMAITTVEVKDQESQRMTILDPITLIIVGTEG